MKSLRTLAKELGVSASYLSQVNNGKKKASSRVLNLLTSVNQNRKENVNQNHKKTQLTCHPVTVGQSRVQIPQGSP